MKFYQKWQGRNCTEGRNEWFDAVVPGNIQKDYAIKNNFKDWQFSDNYRQFLQLEDDFWEYRATLNYTCLDGERVYFVSEGISYQFDIILNGNVIYSYEGMFAKTELDITNYLTQDNNELIIRIHPHPKRKGAMKNTRDEADDSCNPPVYYGWDWNPRLLISGIWDETYIETRGVGYISNLEVLSRLNDDLNEGSVNCLFNCDSEVVIKLYDACGNEVYSGKDKNFTVKNPNLWWCNGQGEPYLYKYVITSKTDERVGYVGFRKVRLVRNAECRGPSTFPKGRYEAPITIELNGRTIFGKGSNWVNPELFWGDITTERYEELILLAKNCNMNIFRMWGGAGAPKKSFYDICDREGIMLWQEFMLACNNYQATPHYMKVLENEASAIIKKFRHHPSLIFWCGGNELFNEWSGMDEQSHPLRLLNKLCFELDYERPFLYTSPLYGMSHGGYTFYSDDQGGDVFMQFQNAKCTAYTEFGVPSMADVDVLRQIIPNDELFPIKDTNAWTAHHAFNAWGKSRWASLDVYARYFKPAKSIEEFVENSQWMQCEGYRGAFEEMRRQWPRCSMAVNWCFNEPWKTAAGNNLITYPNVIKKAYYYVQNALRPTLFSAKVSKFSWENGEFFEAELWLLNDAPTSVEGKVSVTALVGEQEFKLFDWEAQTEKNTNKRGPTVRFKLPTANTDRIILKLTSNDNMGSEYHFRYKVKEVEEFTHRQMNI